MTKQERIEAEKTRLFELFKNMDANQLETARGLISSAAFLRVSLEDLEIIINENGYIDEYENGSNQRGQKISAAVQSYNGLCAKYTTIVTKLLSIVPPEPRKPKEKSEIELEQERRKKEQLEKIDRQREMDEAFDEALRKGEVKHAVGSEMRDIYRAFCEEWERQHAE